MSDITVKVQILRNGSTVIDEFMMNPLARFFMWESPTPELDIVIMPEQVRLGRIKIECLIYKKGEKI